MTARETVIANIECQSTGRIGFNFHGGERRNDLAGCGTDYPFTQKRWVEGEFEYYDDAWGNVWHRKVGMSQGGEVCRPVLADWADLDNLVLPDLANLAYFASARKLVAGEREKFRYGGLPGFPFAVCRYMRKMEVYFMDVVEEPERIAILHDRVTTLLEGIIAQFGEAGMDGVFFCEDLGTQNRLLIGPPMWRRLYRPLYERLTSTAHRYGMKVIQHSCGYNWDLVDDLCDAGIDCLQFDQPAVYDQPALAARLRKHGVGLFSPCDIQQVLPTGDRELIERETRRLVDTFRGGFMAKNYGDLPGIGVKPEWDAWAYEAFVKYGGA